MLARTQTNTNTESMQSELTNAHNASMHTQAHTHTPLLSLSLFGCIQPLTNSTHW